MYKITTHLMEIYPVHSVFTKNDAPMDFKNPVR